MGAIMASGELGEAATILNEEKRRRVEASLSAGLDTKDALVLPLAIALARLAARGTEALVEASL